MDEEQVDPTPEPPEDDDADLSALEAVWAQGNKTLAALADQITTLFPTVLDMLHTAAAERRAMAETQDTINGLLRRIDERGVIFEGLLVLIILLIVSSTLQRLAVIDQHAYYGAVLLFGVLASGVILWRHPHDRG